VKRLRTTAFSLLELIVVLLIMGTVGSVIVACFMGGVRAYERARDFGRGEVDACLAFELLERDLKNSVRVPGIPFAGEGMVMQFPTATSASGVKGGGGTDVTVVRYWERHGGGIMRSMATLGAIASAAPGQEEETLISGEASMRLSYRKGEAPPAQSHWVETWQSTSNFPQQVRIRVSGGELGAVVLERTILIPVTGE